MVMLCKLKNSTFLFLITCFIHSVIFYRFTYSIEASCRPKRFDEICRSDEDCTGPYDQCFYGRCTCASNFDQFVISDRVKTCRPAPNQIGADCINQCQPPLICSQGKCICWKGSSVGGMCTIPCQPGTQLVGQFCKKLSFVLGGLCYTDDDCAVPNSFCSRGICACVQGSVRLGSSCYLNCPDGSAPTQSCQKIMVNEPSAEANAEKMDTCPKGYACATYGKPNVGHCCRLYCPYGYPDLSKSCNGEGYASGNTCTATGTHYCQMFEDHGVKNALCCPTPCQPPNSLYIGNRCYPVAHLGDACIQDGQCEGGQTMHCAGRICRCKGGATESRTEKYPTCFKRCVLGVHVEGGCFQKAHFGDACLSSSMCPKKSVCREGLCQCDCESALSANKCINPDDPMNLNTLLDTFTDLLGG